MNEAHELSGALMVPLVNHTEDVLLPLHTSQRMAPQLGNQRMQGAPNFLQFSETINIYKTTKQVLGHI